MKTLEMIIISGIAAAASAQGTMTMTWAVSDTGNGDGIVEPGESALLTLSAGMNPDQSGNGGGYAGSIFEVLGISNWATGTVDSFVNLVDTLANGPGTLGAGNDITGIESFQLAFDFNGAFDPSNPIAIYAITWTPSTYAVRTVELTSANHANFSVYDTPSGHNIEYTGDVHGTSFQVVPAPGPLALLGLGGLAVTRRRCRSIAH